MTSVEQDSGEDELWIRLLLKRLEESVGWRFTRLLQGMPFASPKKRLYTHTTCVYEYVCIRCVSLCIYTCVHTHSRFEVLKRFLEGGQHRDLPTGCKAIHENDHGSCHPSYLSLEPHHGHAGNVRYWMQASGPGV